jgi:hypothetical protein
VFYPTPKKIEMVKKISKLGSFTVFMLLLVVLLISVMFTRYLPLEGFINYKQDLSQLTSVMIPPYTNTRNIIKLYDSIYFDDKTGHVLELFGSSDSNLPDTDGSSLTNMVLMPRSDTDVVHYNVVSGNTFSNNVIETQYIQSSLVSSYGSWYYPNAGSIGTLSFNYQILYFPWKTDTVLVIYDILAKKIVGCVPILKESSTRLITTTEAVPTTHTSDNNAKNGKYVEVLPQYQSILSSYIENTAAVPCNKMYQICENVWFDTDNAILVMNSTSSNGGGDVVVNTTASFTIHENTDMSVTQCAFMHDNVGKNLIICVPFSKKRALVCIVCVNEDDSKLLSIRRVVRFDPSAPGGIDGAATSSDVITTSSLPSVVVESDSGKWMLKSQCMPPVCPACPSCNCANSGGGGATPTVCADCQQGKNSLSSLIANSYTASDRWKHGQGTGGGGGDGPVSNLITGTRDVLVGAENTVGNVVDTAVGGTALLGLGAIGGAADLGKNVVGDVTNLGGAVAGDTAGVANNIIDSVESIVNNAMNDLTQRVGGAATNAPLSSPEEEEDVKKCKEDTHKKRQKKTTPPPCAAALQGGYQMAQGPGLNNYYGALGGRGASEFMPVTSDFSKFGR